MPLSYRILMTGIAAASSAGPAAAQTMQLDVAIPRLTVAEYHRPYVAIWLEQQGGPARTLQIWYDHDMPKNEGTKWLRDVRQWWRASGRALKLPADGVSGATRAPGRHSVSFVNGRGPLGRLAPGQYVLVVEAAREVGGRELLRLPFAWPPKPGVAATARGQSELGAATLTFKR
ncbi:DUF2271 domain-containing protein [Sphingomonas baiyangensis]|uniref:DUF2271 domain-containing protein n=1 Tax=Sphingomonas baiyangensis TaxID=2572576 RepID=A0A4U1L6X6_9SPHN|nr:DUF2271 domain-containing protein [Sphingomonas baiyangensis]TKD51986.1 DUF2271 domain-containing protein [Sphingomonas baiyangensis]